LEHCRSLEFAILIGVVGEQEPALTSCEDALREPPEERGSISLALHGDVNVNYTKRFIVVQGYVIDLAAGLQLRWDYH
jgi:hypothetical protein